MAKQSKVLNALEQKLHDLAVESFTVARGKAQAFLDQAQAKLQTDLAPLRTALAVPDGCAMNCHTDEAGVVTATWDLVPAAAKTPSSGVIPLKIQRKRK